jgi:hypothetical protein
MTGSMIDSNVETVHSVAEGETLNLLEPASKKEYVEKELYKSKGLFVQKWIASKRIDTENSNYFSEFMSRFLDKSKFDKCKQMALVILGGIIAISILGIIFIGMAFVSDRITSSLPGFVKTGLSILLTFVVLPLGLLRLLPILPLSPKALETKFSHSSRNILMDSANPKWINSHIYTAWPILNDSLKLDPTVAQSHRDIVTNSEEFGSNSIWHSMNSYCHKFLVKWSSVNPKERVPMILWAFNPPSSESGVWGGLREQHIDYAQRQFTKQIRDLLEGMDNLTVRDKTLKEWGQSDYSFRWLDSKMKDQTPRDNVLVKTLLKWHSM